MAVYHDHFTVITVIDPVSQQNKMHLVKRESLYTDFGQLFYKFFPDRTAAKIIINKAHFKSFIYLFNQDVFYLRTYITILKNIILDMDMIFGIR